MASKRLSIVSTKLSKGSRASDFGGKDCISRSKAADLRSYRFLCLAIVLLVKVAEAKIVDMAFQLRAGLS